MIKVNLGKHRSCLELMDFFGLSFGLEIEFTYPNRNFDNNYLKILIKVIDAAAVDMDLETS